jgi:hypothetical protein
VATLLPSAPVIVRPEVALPLMMPLTWKARRLSAPVIVRPETLS